MEKLENAMTNGMRGRDKNKGGSDVKMRNGDENKGCSIRKKKNGCGRKKKKRISNITGFHKRYDEV